MAMRRTSSIVAVCGSGMGLRAGNGTQIGAGSWARSRIRSRIGAKSGLRLRPGTGPAIHRPLHFPPAASFSTSAPRREIRDLAAIPDRIEPLYQDTAASSLLTLHWPQPPRNVLIMPKLLAPHVTQAAVTFAQHLQRNYPGLHLVFEKHVATTIHEKLSGPVYTTSESTGLPSKIDVIVTLGGDGTILRAASLFALEPSVPPILSFSMGTLGFLGEWKFDEYKRAWREVYMSGSGVAVDDLVGPHTQIAARAQSRSGSVSDSGPVSGPISPSNSEAPVSWGGVRGQSMGVQRMSRMLLRNRLRVSVFDKDGRNINSQLIAANDESTGSLGAVSTPAHLHAINELLIHRGPHPHLTVIDIYINNHFLTEAVADGILVSTATGSTAYSLSAGGAIIHPLVGALQITPICPRSLSFRPLVLPLSTRVGLRLSPRNRGRELELSIDGQCRGGGVGVGMEVRIEGEMVGRSPDGHSWRGGVPCVIRAPRRGPMDRSSSGGAISSVPGASSAVSSGSNHDALEDDDGWVGGLNGLLKFNYPFGEAPQDD